MRLLLLFEPGFALALIALVTRYAHEPSIRVAFVISAVAALAILPLSLLLRRGPSPDADSHADADADLDADPQNGEAAEDA